MLLGLANGKHMSARRQYLAYDIKRYEYSRLCCAVILHCMTLNRQILFSRRFVARVCKIRMTAVNNTTSLDCPWALLSPYRHTKMLSTLLHYCNRWSSFCLLYNTSFAEIMPPIRLYKRWEAGIGVGKSWCSDAQPDITWFGPWILNFTLSPYTFGLFYE